MSTGAPYQPSIEQDGQHDAPPLVLVHGTPRALARMLVDGLATGG